MIYLFTEPVSPTKAKVGVIHYRPDLLNEEQKARAIVVDSVPEAVQQKGKSAQLYINPQTKEMWFEYTDRPLTQEELLQDISDKLDTLIAFQKGR